MINILSQAICYAFFPSQTIRASEGTREGNFLPETSVFAGILVFTTTTPIGRRFDGGVYDELIEYPDRHITLPYVPSR